MDYISVHSAETFTYSMIFPQIHLNLAWRNSWKRSA